MREHYPTFLPAQAQFPNQLGQLKPIEGHMATTRDALEGGMTAAL
jgi:hypothetical protein